MATFLGLTAKTAAQLSASDYLPIAHVADTTDYKVLVSQLAILVGSNLVSANVTAAANTSAITVASYSLTGSDTHPVVDLAGTWNTSGAATAIKLNITNTGSGAASLLMDLQIGGTSQFKVSKAGAVTALGAITYASASLPSTTVSFTDGAGVATGTLLTAPSAGNPAKWIAINDNGTTLYIPAWSA